MKGSGSRGPPTIECAELTVDEQLALASAISDSLKGSGVALVNGPKIVIDTFGGDGPDESEVEAIVVSFVARRKEAKDYYVEKTGDALVVHSADPVAAPKTRPTEKLPPNLYKCAFCSFVTPYEEAYVVHTRSHGAMG